MAKITRPQSGNVVRDARRQVRGAEQFGNARNDVQQFASVPEQAFGDSSGQIAIANAVNNIGNIVLDVEKRKRAIEETEEKIDFQTRAVKFNAGEQKLRHEIKLAAEKDNLNANRQKEMYDIGIDALNLDSFADTNYKWLNADAVENSKVENQNKLLNAYTNGALEKARLNGIATNYSDAITNIVDGATINGQESDLLSFEGIINALNAYGESPEFQGTYGATGAKVIDDAKTNALRKYITGQAEINTDAAQVLLDDDKTFAAFEPDVAIEMREHLQSIVDVEKTKSDKAKTKAGSDEIDRIALSFANNESIETIKSINENTLLDDGQKARAINFYKQKQSRIKNEAAAAANGNNDLYDARFSGRRGSKKQKELLSKDFLLRTQNDINSNLTVKQITKKWIDIFNESKYITPKIGDMLTSIITTSQNTKEIAVARDVINYLSSQDPRISKNITEDAFIMADTMALGVSVDNARTYKIDAANITPEMKEINNEILSDLSDNDIVDMIDDSIRTTSFFTIDGDITVSPVIIGKFKELYEKNLNRFIDPSIALRTTKAQFRNNSGYKYNSIDGSNRVMKMDFIPNKRSKMIFDRLLKNHKLGDNVIIERAGSSSKEAPLYILKKDEKTLMGVQRDMMGNIIYIRDNIPALAPITYSPNGNMIKKRYRD